MANTKITITFTKDDNSFDGYVHSFPDDATLTRIIDAHQKLYAELDTDPNSQTFGQMLDVNKNKARKKMVNWAIQNWKSAAVNYEQQVAAATATANVASITSTEL